MRYCIRTGVDGRVLSVDEVVETAIADVRRNESQIAEQLATLNETERDARRREYVTCGLPSALELAKDASLTSAGFAQCCTALRYGLISEAPLRRDVRELARLYLLLTTRDVGLPATTDEHHRLWDTLLADEPFRDPSFKTSAYRQGFIPFTSRLKPVESLPAGSATVAEEDIEHEMEALLAFLQDKSVDRELRSSAGVYLHDRIHPFFDGNGHMGRAIACLALGDGCSVETKLALARKLQNERPATFRAFSALTETHGDLRSWVVLMLGMLADAQGEVLARSGGASICQVPAITYPTRTNPSS